MKRTTSHAACQIMEVGQYQSGRIKILNDLSKFIEDAQSKADAFIRDMGWTKEKLVTPNGANASEKGENRSLLQCPYDGNHYVNPDNIENHIKLCKLKTRGFKDVQLKDLPESSSFFYNSLSSVGQVFLGKEQFDSLGVSFDDPKSQHHEATQQELFKPINPDMIANVKHTPEEKEIKSIEDDNPRTLKIIQTPVEELKCIYSWDTVSSNYKYLDIKLLESNTLKAWLVKNIPDNQLSNVAGADVKLMNFILDCLKIPDCHPDSLVKQLSDLFFGETPSFVLKLWIFLAASIICKKHNISEVVRQEAEVVAKLAKRRKTSDKVNLGLETKQLSAPSLDSPSTEPESCLPVNLMMTYLTTEQRLKLYEYVVESGKSKGKISTVTVEDLEKETEEQINALMALEQDDDRPRSHLEAIAELRDYKRRRQTYRARNQNINRRSATDVLRELIDQQTKYLEIIGGKKITDVDQNNEMEESPKLLEDKSDSPRDRRREGGYSEHSDDRKERRRSSRDERGSKSTERSRFDDRRSNRDYRYDRRNRNERRNRDRSRERLQEHDRYRDKRYVDRDRDRRTSKDGSGEGEREVGRDVNRDRGEKALDQDRVKEGYRGEKRNDNNKMDTYASENITMKSTDNNEYNDDTNELNYDDEISEGLKNIRYNSDISKSLEGKSNEHLLQNVVPGAKISTSLDQGNAEAPVDTFKSFDNDDLRREEDLSKNKATKYNSSSDDDDNDYDDDGDDNDDGRKRHKKSKHKHKHKKSKHRRKSKKRKHEEETQ